MNPREVFFQALNHFQNGEADKAEPLCQQLLRINSREVNTLRLYAQIQLSKGKLEEAGDIFSQVVKIAPDYAHAYMDLGAVRKEQGDLVAAKQHLKKALSIDGALNRAKRLLHEVLVVLEDDEAAALGEIVQQRDQIAESVKKALKFFQEKKYKELEAVGQEVLAKDPGNLAIMRVLAEYATQEFNSFRAERLFRQIVKKSPENWRAWNGLGRSLSMQERTEEAFNAFQRSQEISPDTEETQMLVADTYIKRYDYEAGIKLYRDIIARQPDFNAARSQLGLALKTVGEQEEAIKDFEHCIKNNEAYGEAYWSLSDMKTYAFSDEQISTMERVFTDEDLPDKDRVYIGYALGKAYEHQKEYLRAFGFYESANKVQKRLLAYNADDTERFTDQIIDTFDAQLFEALGKTDIADVTPVFVVGLPRSGSTLQEQILASHSMVEGTQELPYLPRLAKFLNQGPSAMTSEPFPGGIKNLTREQITKLGENYLSQAKFHRKQGKPFFIDKLPNNFAYIGLIALCFPNAKIINARRHPMDSCLGCYKQLWAMGQNFTYDLEDLGRYYRDYDRLMKHWHKVLPGRVLDVQYEDVVDDLEAQVHRLLDYCDLPFEQNCIEFHKTKRVVKTSSSEQVRQPIYRSALAYWKNFGDKLDPLKGALEDLLAD